ncbi:MAG: DUF192 domain-containing protein [bacterium]|nr:DUF192 domain-containing protein [bacterium]
MKQLISIVIIFGFFMGPSVAMEELPQKVRIGTTEAWLEIADEADEIQRGLSYRYEMDWNRGMLFCFPNAERRGFWMRHCYFDIDLAYLDSNGVIQQILLMKAEPIGTPSSRLKIYYSDSDAIQYVIEMNAGWFEANQIKVGDTADVTKFRSKLNLPIKNKTKSHSKN